MADVRISSGFTDSLQPTEVIPVFLVEAVDFSNASPQTILIQEVSVPQSQCLVVTSIVFRTIANGAGGTGNTTVQGVDNPWLFATSLAWQVAVDGQLTSAGKFAFRDRTAATGLGGFPLINTNISDALGWYGGYGLAIGPGGKLTISATQNAGIAGGTVPARLGSEVGGFFCAPGFANDYLNRQGRR